MREKLARAFLTLDMPSFWFGAVCALWLCLMLSMAYTIVCLRLDNRRVRRAEEVVDKYGRHSQSFREGDNSATTEVIPIPAPAPRPYYSQGRTDTNELPRTRA